jgi:hypothetical protein
MGAILWSHMGRMVFAASIEQIAARIDQIMVTSAELAAKATFAPIAITGGVLADDAMKLFPNKPWGMIPEKWTPVFRKLRRQEIHPAQPKLRLVLFRHSLVMRHPLIKKALEVYQLDVPRTMTRLTNCISSKSRRWYQQAHFTILRNDAAQGGDLIPRRLLRWPMLHLNTDNYSFEAGTLDGGGGPNSDTSEQ